MLMGRRKTKKLTFNECHCASTPVGTFIYIILFNFQNKNKKENPPNK